MKTNAAIQEHEIAELSHEPSSDETTSASLLNEVNGAAIGLTVTGSWAELTGKVRTWAERKEDERAV